MAINRRTKELEDEIAALEAEQQGATPPQEAPPVEEPSAPVVELSPTEKTYEKRYGDLRRHTTKVIEELKAEVDKLKSKPAPTAGGLTTEQVKKWAETNPQANAIIRAIAEEQAGVRVSEVSTKFAEIDEINAELAHSRAMAKVLKVHDDFEDVVKSVEFHDWAERQPKFIQDKIYDNFDANDTIWAISLYKREKSPVDNNDTAKAVRSSGAAPSSSKPKGRWTESKVKAMSAQEFEKHEAEIMAARMNKEFYDLTDVSGYR
jgi:hypothetical protein